MILQGLKCKNCGGVLEVDYSYHRATCKYCGTNYYLEKNSNNEPNNFSVEDNPTCIQIVMCENDLPIKISDRFEFALRVIAGLAHCLKKSYRVNPIVFNDDQSSSSLRANYVIDKNDVKKKINDHKRLSRAYPTSREEHMGQIAFFENIPSKYEETSRKNAEYIRGLIRRLESCGMTVTDTKKTIISTSSSVKMTYEQHLITGTVPTITPDYFSSHFRVAYNKYLRIRSLEVTSSMAEALSRYIHQLNSLITNGVTVGLEVTTTGCKFKTIHYKSIQSNNGNASNLLQSNYLQYHSYGMDNIDCDDIETLSALTVALSEKIINMTQYNRRDVLDLSSTYTIPHPDEEYFDKNSFTIPFRYIKESFKSYQKW